jgi:hypothetical protein
VAVPLVIEACIPGFPVREFLEASSRELGEEAFFVRHARYFKAFDLIELSEVFRTWGFS